MADKKEALCRLLKRGDCLIFPRFRQTCMMLEARVDDSRVKAPSFWQFNTASLNAIVQLQRYSSIDGEAQEASIVADKTVAEAVMTVAGSN